MLNNKIVYSTEIGRITENKTTENIPKSDGIVRIQRQVSGRNGKPVSVISGFGLSEAKLKSLATELKKRCGVGGAVKNHTIEIQGDKRDLIKEILTQKGFNVKLAGG